MLSPVSSLALLAIPLASSLTPARGIVVLNPLFGDHAVLQAGRAVPVWGRADAGETVTVAVEKTRATATAGPDGRWRVVLPPLGPGGPVDAVVRGDRGEDPLILHDFLIGEVWLASGQSNMDFTVARTPRKYFAGTRDEAGEIAAANYPRLRMFTGSPIRAAEPQEANPGEWRICSPATVGDFSAVAYFFARELQRKLGVPVGMITMAYGASTAEAWVGREDLAAEPQLRPMLERFDRAAAGFKSSPPVALRPPAESGGRAHRVRDPDPVHDQHNPTVLFNGMIAPIIPYAIRGAIWYQGESIVGGAEGVRLYPVVQAALVREWRRLWGEGAFPFYIVQLAGQEAGSNSPWVREAQASVLSLPNTGVALAYDIGEAKNVHPKNKQDVGFRLALIALARTYGERIEDSGPQFAALARQGSQLLIRFSHAAGLRARQEPLGGFVVAGADGIFHAASARVDGETVVVATPGIAKPVMVRYAWANYPADANLINGAGLPAAPFRAESP